MTITKPNPSYFPPELDSQDIQIRAEKLAAFDEIPAPRVGDFIRFADGVLRRISHLWTEMEEVGMEDSAQTSDSGSFYFGNGYISFSGSLFDGTPIAKLRPTSEEKFGSVWFFHHDYAAADNGIDTSIKFRVYETDEEATR